MKRTLLLLLFTLTVLTGCHNGETNSKSINSESSLSTSEPTSTEQLISDSAEQPNSTTRVDAFTETSSTYTTVSMNQEPIQPPTTDISNEEHNNSSSVEAKGKNQSITIQETTTEFSVGTDSTSNNEQPYINESEAENLSPIASPDDDTGVVVFPIMPIE